MLVEEKDWSDMSYIEIKREWKKQKVSLIDGEFNNETLWNIVSLIEELMKRYEDEDI